MEDRDKEHLNLLGNFHFLFAGLSLFLVLAFSVHLALSGILGPEEGEAGRELYAGIDRFLTGGIFVCTALGLLGLVSGLGLKRLRWRGLTITIAAIECLAAPAGTVLGLFTIVVLRRSSVRELYREAAA